MTSFIPNFNAPSQNYAASSLTPYSKRRHSRDSNRGGSDPRNRRRRVRSSAPAGTRVETLPDGTQVSVTPKMRGMRVRQQQKTSGTEAKSTKATNETMRFLSSMGMIPGQGTSDFIMTPEETERRRRAAAMQKMANMRYSGSAPSSWYGQSVLGDPSELTGTGGIAYSRFYPLLAD
jgi:hypothetical protein